MTVVLGSVEYLYLKESAMDMNKLIQSLMAGKIVAQFGVMGGVYESMEDRIRHANNCIKACLDAAVIMKVALIDKDSDAIEPSHSLVGNGDKLHVMFEAMFEPKKTTEPSAN